jgi:Ca2+-binding EF-hand superfamily protein
MNYAQRGSASNFGTMRPSMRSIESGYSNKTFNFPSSRKSKNYKLKEEEAPQVAKRIFDHYDRNRSMELTDDDIIRMMKDAYAHVDPNYTPTTEEIESYRRNMDRTGDGRATIQDMEMIVMQYFCQEDPVGMEFSRLSNPQARGMPKSVMYN